MKNCKEFYLNKDGTWSIVYQDDSISITDKLPIDFDYIGNSHFLCFVHCSEYIQSCHWNFIDDGKLCPISRYFKWGFINSQFQITVEPRYDFESGVNSTYYDEGTTQILDSKEYGLSWENGNCRVLENEKEIILKESDLIKRINIKKNGEIMMNYAERLNKAKCSNIVEIARMCYDSLPIEHKARPWRHPELNHGLDLLHSDVALDCYMAAYGDMHINKCRTSMMNFPYEQLQGTIEIVDWGCGQGIGSATVIDILLQHDKLQWLRKVTLIEPSEQALDRAVCNISKLTHNRVLVDAINKFMPSKGKSPDELKELGYSYTNVIHIFSNILDVTVIDLASVARMVASSHGNHFILCIGPKNGSAYRIEQFCSVFGKQQYFNHVDNNCLGHTLRTGHPYTCMTRCFAYNGASIDVNRIYSIQGGEIPIYNDYDWNLHIQNHLMSRSKARVAYRLQNILSLDDILYIDPVINEVKVDFVIVRPGKGILLVNVFDNDLKQCKYNKELKTIINADKKFQSPIDLISVCQTSIKDGIEELLLSTIQDSRNFNLIKKAVVFTENNKSTVDTFFAGEDRKYTCLYGNEFIFDRGASANIFAQLSLLNNNPNFDGAVVRKLASILSPKWHSYQEGKLGIEPKGAQKRLCKSQIVQQKISGVAGAGKTHVLAARAINAMKRTGGNVLILTYNITLVNYLRFRLSEIREDFSWECIDIFHYHQFFRIRASECRLQVSFNSYEDTTFFENSKNYKKYSAIFVDEVQDYTTEWLKIVKMYFLENNGEFVVFGDPKQNVYHRPLDKKGDIRLGVIGGVWNKELTTARRFTNPRLASLATSFQSSFFKNQVADNIRAEIVEENTFNFKIVNYVDLRTNRSFENLISTVINIINDDNNDARDFVVLSSYTKLLRKLDFTYRQRTGQTTEVTFVATEPFEKLKKIHHVVDEQHADWKFNKDYEALERARKQQFTTDKRCLKISTIQSFKGWESSSVIVILDEGLLMEKSSFTPMSPETIYTAITRAKENLYIVNYGNIMYDEFFTNQSR